MKISISLFTLCLIIILNQAPAFSQTQYSLYDIALLANKLSETIKIAQDDVFIAQQDKQKALSVIIPRATAYGAMTDYKENDTANPDTLTIGAKLTQSFTINGKELIAYGVSKNRIESKQFSLEAIRSQYLLQVAQVYFNILSAQKFFEIARSDVKRLTIHKDAVKKKLIIGSVTKTDLYRAEAELSKALTEDVKAKNRVLQAKAALKNLVDIDEDFILKKDNIIENSNTEFTLKEIQSFALKNRSEIKEAYKDLEIAQKSIKFNKSDYWPKLSLETGYKETDIEIENNTKYEKEDVYFSGELVFTLYDGGLRRAQIKQDIANLRKAQNALSLKKKQIILEAKTNYLDHKTAQTTLLNLQDELKFAHENFNAVTMQFKYGMADSINIMDANTLLVSAQRRISDAQYIYYFSILKIFYTKGELNQFLLRARYK